MKIGMFLAASAAALTMASAASAKTVAVTAARMIDVVAGKTLDNPVVIVTNLVGCTPRAACRHRRQVLEVERRVADPAAQVRQRV
ncbi:MAG: hypothetical protein ACXWVJ_05025, partial [Caulobacteraceae bacterium]